MCVHVLFRVQNWNVDVLFTDSKTNKFHQAAYDMWVRVQIYVHKKLGIFFFYFSPFFYCEIRFTPVSINDSLRFPHTQWAESNDYENLWQV